MTDSAMRVSHRVVRIIATITLADLGMGVACLKYPSTLCYAVANGWPSTMMTFWTIVTSLLLPLYVGLEGWLMRKNQGIGRALWIDATLALACLVLLCGGTLYAFRHYVMF